MRCALWAGTLFFFVALGTQAQETAKEDKIPSALRDKALSVLIAARILDENDAAIWEASANKHTIPGRAVMIKMVGTNLIILASFTPYLSSGSDDHILLAQGEVWAMADGGNVRYHSSVQTIPMKLGEMVYFFPLGTTAKAVNSDRIVVTIEVIPDPEAAE